MKINDNGTIKDLVVKASDTLPIGSIIPFGGTEAPTNWLICDGSGLNREAYPELFEAIGTSFGTDGPGNFYIPDLRGRVIVGQDESDADFGIGLTGGEKTHTLTVDEMPKHSHRLNTIYPFEAGGAKTGLPNSNANSFYSEDYLTCRSTGGDQPHNILQPYTVTNYIIKAKQSVGVVGNVVNEKTTSDKDTYSCDYINGTILYENASGSNEDITLNDSAANYSKLVIEYKSNNAVYSSVEISNPNSRRVRLMGDGESLETHIMLLDYTAQIIETKITWLKKVFVTFTANQDIEVSQETDYYNLKITKVVGYR